MKQTINEYQFRDAFHDMGRGDQFSHQGLGALYEMLADYEDGTGEEIELDPIAICCDFSECTAAEIAQDYSIDLSEAIEQKITLSEDIDLSDNYRSSFNKWLADTFGVVSVDEEMVKDIVTDYLSENTWYCTVDDNGADTSIIYQAF